MVAIEKANLTTSKMEINSIESAYSWFVGCMSLLMTSLSFGAITAVPILMKPMSEELLWGRARLASIHTAAFVCAAVGCIIVGLASDRIKFFWLALLAALSIGAGLFLTSRAHDPWMFYAAYGILVGGVGQGTFFSPITAAASHWFDRNRHFAIALITCGQGVGGLIVPVVLRYGAELIGWRDAMASYGLACFTIMSVASVVFLRDPPAKSHPHGTGQNGSNVSGANWAAYRFAMIHITFGSIGMFLFIAHFIILCEERQIAPFVAAILLSAMLGIATCSRLLTGLLLNRLSHERVIFGSNLVLTTGIVIVAGAGDNIPIIAIGALLFGVGFGSCFPAYATLVRANFPAQQFGFWLSTLWFLSFLGAGFGSWIGGYLHDIFGNYLFPLVFAAIIVTAGCLIAQFNSFLFSCVIYLISTAK